VRRLASADTAKSTKLGRAAQLSCGSPDAGSFSAHHLPLSMCTVIVLLCLFSFRLSERRRVRNCNSSVLVIDARGPT
jgi:hypothetical protein